MVVVSSSEVNWTPLGTDYINSSRGLSSTEELESDLFLKVSSLSSIEDLSINHNSLFYLTSMRRLDTMIDNKFVTSAFDVEYLPLSSEELELGWSGESKMVKYHFCNSNNPQLNSTTDIGDYSILSGINYILTAPYKGDFKFNILNLKNYMTPYYEYDSIESELPRKYTKIHTGSNQSNGLHDIYLGYDGDVIEITFKHNDTTYFHYPINSERIPISESNIILNGAKPGDVPMNSDIIGLDRYNYHEYNSMNRSEPSKNGQFLCAWLSGSNDCYCESVWVERWYDSDIVSMGDAYIEKVNSDECVAVWDIPSTMELIPGNRYYYDRYGKDRNEVVLELVKTHEILNIESWGESITNESGEKIGSTIPPQKSSPELVLKGTNYVQLPPADFLFLKHQISVSIDTYKDNWCCGKNSQLIGNYRFGGWGIFFNSGIPNNIITMGDDFGNLYSFNIEGTKIFEKNTDTYDIQNVQFDWVSTDLNGARWLLDSRNNKLFKVDVDDLITTIVNLPPSYEVTKLQISENNEVMFFDNGTKFVFVHDENGNFLRTIDSENPEATTFEVLKDDEIVFSNGNIITINSKGDIYKSWGSNLYKNDLVIYNFNKSIMDMKLDSEDNLYVVYDGNKVVKITEKDKIEFNIKTFDEFVDETTARIGLIRKSNSEGCDSDGIWIVYGDYRHLVQLTPTGSIVDYKNISSLIVTRNCDNFTLKATGDFTGYDIYRKFEVIDNTNISPKNPALSLKIKFKDSCGNSLHKSLNMPACNLAAGWHTLGFSFNTTSGIIRFYVDGTIAVEEAIEESYWEIDYNETTPIIIGGNSGKLGSENEEKSIIDSQYFIGKIRNVSIYSTEIPQFHFKSIYDDRYGKFEDLVWNIKIDPRSYIEKIEKFFFNKKPGSSTNLFNIKINGLEIEKDLKLLIEKSIESSIDKILPKYTKLNSVVWEEKND